jgi:glycerol-3-phosphate acyltransferase PlsY
VIIQLAAVVGAYLLGSVPTSLHVVRLATGRDIRRLGSGNVGTTNAVRAAGLRLGLLVGLLDVLKGVLAVAAMAAVEPASAWQGAAAVAAVLGHCFPVWLRFRGGKGVLAAGGAFLVLAPLATLAATGLAVLVLAWRRVVSLASLVGAVALPPALWWIAKAPTGLLVAGSVTAVVIVARHAGNVRRLAAGTEPRMGERHPKDGGGG